MLETNGKPNGWWTKIPPLVALLIGLLPGVGGYFVMQYRVSIIESHYVSQDQLIIAIQNAIKDQGVQAEKVVELTDAVNKLSEKIDRMYGAWSMYSAHPKGHKE
jgi:regulator of RNase E activity RraB